MKPLIDCDVLLYEIGFSSQQVVDGEIEPNSWEFCQNLFDEKVKLICDEVGATEPPLLFLTSTPYITKMLNKSRKRNEEVVKDFVPNFRNDIAVTKEYKGGRKETKPYHFYNLINYITSQYEIYVDESGLEADDAMCIYQFSRLDDANTIICSRDKDLKQCPGWHFTWECGKQPSWGPKWINEIGFLENVNEGKINPKTNKPMPLKVRGGGHLFFYYQMLTGDGVDNIPGAMGRGPALAYRVLHDITDERTAYELTAEKYVQVYGDVWEEKWNEMSGLLWMVRKLDEEGKPIPWKVPPYVEGPIDATIIEKVT